MFLESWKLSVLANYAHCVHLSKICRLRRGLLAERSHLRPCRWLLAEDSHPPCGKDMACGDDSFFVTHKQYFCQGVLSQNVRRTENPRHGDTFSFIILVSLDGFRWGFVSFELKNQRMIWPEPWSRKKLLRTESCGSKVGFMVQKSHVSETWKWSIWANYARCGTCLKFFGPAGGCSLSTRFPLVVGIWLVETILSLYRQSYKQYFCQRVRSQNVGRRENPRHGDTFSFISLVSLDGFRWGFANFQLKHEEWYGPSLGAQKIYWGRKVVGARSDSWCKNRMFLESWKWSVLANYARCMHSSKMLRPCQGLLAERSLPPLWYGYGLWRRFFLCEPYKQYFFVRGCFRKMLVEKKTRHVDTLSFITLVSFDRFRWGLANFELKHERMIWPEPWSREKLLRTESGGSKVKFVVQKPHGSGNLKNEEFS